MPTNGIKNQEPMGSELPIFGLLTRASHDQWRGSDGTDWRCTVRTVVQWDALLLEIVELYVNVLPELTAQTEGIIVFERTSVYFKILYWMAWVLVFGIPQKSCLLWHTVLCSWVLVSDHFWAKNAPLCGSVDAHELRATTITDERQQPSHKQSLPIYVYIECFLTLSSSCKLLFAARVSGWIQYPFGSYAFLGWCPPLRSSVTARRAMPR